MITWNLWQKEWGSDVNAGEYRMAIEGEINWCEGLFLQPHHLQIMQRSIAEKFTRQGRFLWCYTYGVIEARIYDDKLVKMSV